MSSLSRGVDNKNRDLLKVSNFNQPYKVDRNNIEMMR